MSCEPPDCFVCPNCQWQCYPLQPVYRNQPHRCPRCKKVSFLKSNLDGIAMGYQRDNADAAEVIYDNYWDAFNNSTYWKPFAIQKEQELQQALNQ